MTSHAAAIGVVTGAWLAVSVPVLGLLVVGGCVLRWRRPEMVVVAALLLGSFVGHRAHEGLAPPPVETIRGWVTILDDPRPVGHAGTAVTVRWADTRLDATGFGSVAGRLDDHSAGERILIAGTVRPADNEWLRWRHVVGRVSVDEIISHAPAPAVHTAATWLRDRLAEGAAALSVDRRSLFTGMVYGDDRYQSAATADAFRAAGLGHLLVVSGQNVAFVLALTAPLTSRLRPAGRLVAVGLILGFFALLTRFEPSVLRAVTMAGLAVAAAVLGRPEDGRRVLSAAIAIVVVIDPFLIRAAAFQLSVAATAGILWLSPRIESVVPGPRPLRLAMATTIGAQVAVTPALLILFGEVPVVSLPANILAGPASGPVLMWGLTGGLVAGVVGGATAEVLHWPTGVLLWWVDAVARAAATAPPVALGPLTGTVVVTGTLAVVVSASRSSRRIAVSAILLVLALAVLRSPAPRAGWSAIDGAALWTTADTTLLVLDRPASAQRLLETLRTGGSGRPDLVVAAHGGLADALAVMALVDRFGSVPVLAPPMHRVPGARVAVPGQTVRVGAAEVIIEASQPAVEVSVRPARPP